MVRRMWVMAVLTGCPCPPVECATTLEIKLDVAAWAPGTWRFSVTPSATPFDCTITIPDNGAPTPLDVTCDGRVDRGGFLFDTGGFLTPDHMVLRTQTTGKVDEVTVSLTHEARTESLAFAVDWVDTSTWVSTCQAGCAYGLIDVQAQMLGFSPSTAE